MIHPECRLACIHSVHIDEKVKLTLPTVATWRPARASVPNIRVMSCTNCFVSFALIDFERSCDTFALRQGCCEMWTLEGSDDAILED